jgi:hypothetical protein
MLSRILTFPSERLFLSLMSMTNLLASPHDRRNQWSLLRWRVDADSGLRLPRHD